MPCRQSGETFQPPHANVLSGVSQRSCINNLLSKCNFLESRTIWARLAGLHQGTHNAASVFFQERWKLASNALLFACISLGDPLLTLAVLHGHELGTAVCFGWDVLGDLEGMGKDERILRVACSVYAYHGEGGNFHCRYNGLHPGSSAVRCLVNLLLPFFF